MAHTQSVQDVHLYKIQYLIGTLLGLHMQCIDKLHSTVKTKYAYLIVNVCV